jgi:hypothetical protein
VSAEHILVRRGVAPIGSGLATMLLPVDPRDDAMLAGIALGETIAIKLVRGRSLPQHRLFFGILDHVAKATAFETAERLLVALKIRLGRYDLLAMPNGKMVPVPQSISFAKMDQADFAKFFDDALRLICTEVIPGTERDDLIREVETMLGISVPAEDWVEAQRRMEAGVPMPVAPTPPSETIPVQDAEPQRRAGAEQSAHTRRPGPAEIGKQ